MLCFENAVGLFLMSSPLSSNISQTFFLGFNLKLTI